LVDDDERGDASLPVAALQTGSGAKHSTHRVWTGHMNAAHSTHCCNISTPRAAATKNGLEASSGVGTGGAVACSGCALTLLLGAVRALAWWLRIPPLPLTSTTSFGVTWRSPPHVRVDQQAVDAALFGARIREGERDRLGGETDG